MRACVRGLGEDDLRFYVAGVIGPTFPQAVTSTGWREGMKPCRCGIDGGRHLFKECPLEQSGQAGTSQATAPSKWVEGMKPCR